MNHLVRYGLSVVGIAGALLTGTSMASAQDFGVRIGGPSFERSGPERVERRIYREERPAFRDREVEVVRPARRRTVCRTIVRERTNPYTGVTIRRPTEVCRTEGGGRRFVD